MKTYSIERIKELLAELAEFNSRDIREITLTENGEPIVIPDSVFDEWKFVGLSNTEFIGLLIYTKDGQNELLAKWVMNSTKETR